LGGALRRTLESRFLEKKEWYRKFHDAQDDVKAPWISDKEIVVVEKLTNCGGLKVRFLRGQQG